MNQATNINVVPGYGQRGDLHFSQYDVGRTATINLFAVNEAYTIPLGATVKIQATKPSGLGFDVACTFSGSVVTVVSTETMTAEAGRFPAELHIIDNSDVIGTANFMFVVEASPHPDGVIDGDAEYVVNEIKALVLKSEGYALGTQDGVPVDNTSPYYHNNSKWWSEHTGFTEEFRQALLDCFSNVAWIGNDGQDYYDALVSAMSPQAELLSISAVYTQSGYVYTTTALDDLKADLVVTGTYDDTSTATIPGSSYTLSGSLTVGTSTITVSYGGKTTTFNVTVSENAVPDGTYTPDEIIRGKYIDNTGTVQDATNESGYFGEYIPLGSNEYVVRYTNAPEYSKINWRLSEYNSSEEFIQQHQYSASSGDRNVAVQIPIDQSTKYIRLGWYNANQTSFVPVFSFKSDMYALPMESGSIDGTTGEDQANTKRIRSDYIEASGTMSVTGQPFTFVQYDGYLFRCYDSSKNFVGSLTNSGNVFTTDISNVALPEGTAYVRFIISRNTNISVGFSSSLITDPITINGVDYWITEVFS